MNRMTPKFWEWLRTIWNTADVSKGGAIGGRTVLPEAAGSVVATLLLSCTERFQFSTWTPNAVFVEVIRQESEELRRFFLTNLLISLRAPILPITTEDPVEDMLTRYGIRTPRRRNQESLVKIALANQATTISRGERLAAKGARSTRGAGSRSKIRPGGVR